MKIPGTTKHIYFGKKDADAPPTQSSAGPSNPPATTSRERPIVPGLVIWSSGKRAPARSADTSAPTRAPRATGEALAQLGVQRETGSSQVPEAPVDEPGLPVGGADSDAVSSKATELLQAKDSYHEAKSMTEAERTCIEKFMAKAVLDPQRALTQRLNYLRGYAAIQHARIAIKSPEAKAAHDVQHPLLRMTMSKANRRRYDTESNRPEYGLGIENLLSLRADLSELAGKGQADQGRQLMPAFDEHVAQMSKRLSPESLHALTRKPTDLPSELISKVFEIVARDETPRDAAVALARAAQANRVMASVAQDILAKSDAEISRIGSRAALERNAQPKNFVSVLHSYPHVEIPEGLSDKVVIGLLKEIAKVTGEDLKKTRSIDMILPLGVHEHDDIATGIPTANVDGAVSLEEAMRNLAQHGNDDLRLTLDMDLGVQATSRRESLWGDPAGTAYRPRLLMGDQPRLLMAQPRSKLRMLTLRASPGSREHPPGYAAFERKIRDGLRSANHAVEHLVLRINASEVGQRRILQVAVDPACKLKSLDLLGNRSLLASAVTEALKKPHNRLEGLSVRLRGMDATDSAVLQQGLMHSNARHLTQLHVELVRAADGPAFGQAIAQALVHVRPAGPDTAAGPSSTSFVNPLRELTISGAEVHQANGMLTNLAVALRDPNCGLRSLTLQEMRPNHDHIRELILAATSPECRVEVLDLRGIRTAAAGSQILSQALAQALQDKPNLKILPPQN